MNSAKVILLYGESGLYKTTNAMFAAKWLYEQYGLPIRVVTAEASSSKIFEPLVAVDAAQFFYIGAAKNPLPTLRHFIAGDVPKDGKWAKSEPCGGYIFEGLSTFSEMVMEDLRTKQRQIGQDVVGKFEEGCTCGAKPRPDGTADHAPGCAVEKFANAAQSHYNFVQGEMLRNLKASAGLPAPYVIWTAHEAASEDMDTRAPIRGPALVGKKKVNEVQKYVSALLHAEGYSTQTKKDGLTYTEQIVRVWFQRHPDLKYANIEYPAKTTLPADRIPDLLKAFPGGFFQPGLAGGLDKFLATEKALSQASTNTLAEWKAKIDAQTKGGGKAA